jgi:hypothetical protein
VHCGGELCTSFVVSPYPYAELYALLNDFKQVSNSTQEILEDLEHTTELGIALALYLLPYDLLEVDTIVDMDGLATNNGIGTLNTGVSTETAADLLPLRVADNRVIVLDVFGSLGPYRRVLAGSTLAA